MQEFEHTAEGVRSGDTVENVVSGERLTFLATSRDTGGAYTRVRFTLPPRGAGTPLHLHTTLSERFEVVSGRLSVVCGGGEPPIVLAPGDSASVPPYTVHRFWNPTDEETVFEAEVRPAGGFEAFMRTSFGLARDGRTSRGGMPRNPMELGLLMQPADVYLPGLPVPVQKAVFGALASAARRLGYETRFRLYADPAAREDGTSDATDAADRAISGGAYRLALRKVDERVQELAAVVGWVSLGMGSALTLSPRSSAASLGWGDRTRLARAVGVADLIVGPALLLSRDRAQWMLARALLNVAISGVYAWSLTTGTPRRGRALGGMVGMSALTVIDYLLAQRLRSVERSGSKPGQ
ncbi:MAG: cupin domain-containing protein [Actinomycetota bacterium]|nr:cupin domain-containing protein [Actinomycetota bacterium]